ncbi:hypothetical protein NHX12_010911 [Muraenolepis orangiensis]|uniref:Uncharacterized protein n=1 Tax=Muraenolepis orangiensis TaxID=630683 RepID=A0A9Q0DGU5_9TELE|nr:hypothetical protein NHX12_010911 [Muraenolepis orangiensis]
MGSHRAAEQEGAQGAGSLADSGVTVGEPHGKPPCCRTGRSPGSGVTGGQWGYSRQQSHGQPLRSPGY